MVENVRVFSSLHTELSMATAAFAKSAAMLGNIEEHTTLSRALSQLAETEEKIEAVHRQQVDTDFYVIAELLKDYIALIGAVKVRHVVRILDLEDVCRDISSLHSALLQKSGLTVFCFF